MRALLRGKLMRYSPLKYPNKYNQKIQKTIQRAKKETDCPNDRMEVAMGDQGGLIADKRGGKRGQHKYIKRGKVLT